MKDTPMMTAPLDQLKAEVQALRALLTSPELLQELSLLEDRLRDFKPKLALMGGWNAGKSTLINELLGLKLLPSSALPETSTLIELTYDASATAQPKLTLIERSGAQHQVDLSEFKEAVQHHPETYLQVGLSHELLRGLDLIDTPGDNSTNIHHQAVFEVIMREAELTLYVIRADRFVLRNDLKHIQTLYARDDGRHLKVIFTHEDLITASQRKAIEEGLTELLPKLSRPLWVQAPLSSDARERLAELLTSWAEREGYSAHVARVLRGLERLKAAQKQLLHQELIALKTGEHLARLSEREREHHLAMCTHQSEALRQHFEHTLTLSDARLKVIFHERFEPMRQASWRESQSIDPLDQGELEMFSQRLIHRAGEVLTEVQALMVEELAQSLNAQLPKRAHIAPLHLDLPTLSMGDVLGDLAELVHKLPEGMKGLVGSIEMILMRDPKLIILVKTLRALRAKEDFAIALATHLEALSQEMISLLQAWWQEITQRLSEHVQERLKRYDVQLQKLSQGHDQARLLLDIQETQERYESLV